MHWGKNIFTIAFDIGTASVSAVVFSVSGSKATCRPAIHNIYKKEFSQDQQIDADILSRYARESLKEVARTAVKETPGTIQHVVVGLSSPFYVSRTSNVRIHRKNPKTPVTAEEIKLSIQQAVDNFLSSQKNNQESLDLFSSTILKTSLNGYRVESVEGIPAKTLEIIIRLEATAVQWKKEMLSVLTPLFSEEKLRFSTVPTACFYALSSLFNSEEGFLLVDIGGEISEVSFIRNNILEKVITLPIGNSALLRRLSEFRHINIKNASFILRRLAEGKLEEGEKISIEPIMNEVIEQWKKALSEEFTRYGLTQNIPSHVVLTGGGAELPYYRNVFSRNFAISVLGIAGLKLTTADVKLFVKSFESIGTLSGSADFNLVCLALLCARDVL